MVFVPFFFSSYEYSLVFRTTSAHTNANALSCLPLPEEAAKALEELELVLLAEHLEESLNDLQVWKQRNKKLVRVFQYVHPTGTAE